MISNETQKGVSGTLLWNSQCRVPLPGVAWGMGSCMALVIETLPDGKVADFIDGKIRNDTPEEYVRQNLERRLVLELDYAPEVIGVEVPIKMGSGKPKRVDIVIFADHDLRSQATARILSRVQERSNQADGQERWCRTTQILHGRLSKCRVGTLDQWTFSSSLSEGDCRG